MSTVKFNCSWYKVAVAINRVGGAISPFCPHVLQQDIEPHRAPNERGRALQEFAFIRTNVS